MTFTLFTEIVVILIIAIIVLYLLSLVSGSGFLKTVFKDEFRSRSEIGNQNLGKTKQVKKYREIAKSRGLDEAKKLSTPLNPKVTTSISNTTKTIREQQSKKGDE